ncbi:MAG: leucine-rich repeat protein, partial [Bacilli bacterium]|nr:leucine-rich repeat protein [Bacilli bacterium]
SIEGSLYSIDGKKLYLYAIGKGSKCVIPDGVEELGNYSIRWDKKTTEVQLPKSVKKIGNQAFGYSTSINKFIYLGTKEEWNNINKASSWKDNSSITKVICTDGEIEL